MKGIIGDVCVFASPYYDTVRRRNDFKARPSLIIGVADLGDYNILPISKVTDRRYLDADYDIPVFPSNYPNLNLNDPSYVRVHKQTVFHDRALHQVLSNMKTSYPELFLSVIVKLEEYSNKLIENSL